MLELIYSNYQLSNFISNAEKANKIVNDYVDEYKPYPKSHFVTVQKQNFITGAPYSVSEERFLYVNREGNEIKFVNLVDAWTEWRKDMNFIAQKYRNQLLEIQFDIEESGMPPWRAKQLTAKEKYLLHIDA